MAPTRSSEKKETEKLNHVVSIGASSNSSSRYRNMSRGIKLSIALAVIGATLLGIEIFIGPAKETPMEHMVTMQYHDEKEHYRANFAREISRGTPQLQESVHDEQSLLRSSRSQRKQVDSKTRNLDTKEEEDEDNFDGKSDEGDEGSEDEIAEPGETDAGDSKPNDLDTGDVDSDDYDADDSDVDDSEAVDDGMTKEDIAVSDGDVTGAANDFSPHAYEAWTILSSSKSSDQKTEGILMMDDDAVAASVDRATTPIFTCTPRDLPRGEDSPKLVFVHVFKTAGSSMRDLLAEYAKSCRAGYAVITGCSDVNVDSIGPKSKKPWTSATQGPCPIKKYVAREGGGMQVFGKDGDQMAENAFIMENVDIVAGHLPLGAGAVFGEGVYPIPATAMGPPNIKAHKRGPTRYVAFFRDAVDKFVSGISFIMTQYGKEVTEDQLIARVKEVVTERYVNRHEFKLNYANYLITPEQESQAAVKMDRISRKDAVITPRAVAVQAMFNLVEWDVLVGHTNFMSESLELVQFVLDPRSVAKEIFLKYGREDRGAFSRHEESENDNEDDGNDSNHENEEEKRGERKKNVSKVSTGDVVATLAATDPDFFAQLEDYVKYEQQIADFALALHKKQYTVMKEKRRELWMARQEKREAVARQRAAQH